VKYFLLLFQFNLAVRDLPEVLVEAKKAMCLEGVDSRLTLCVEISLRTVEGDTMILETWNLGKNLLYFCISWSTITKELRLLQVFFVKNKLTSLNSTEIKL